MDKTIARFGYWTSAILAVGVAVHAMRYAAVPAGVWLDIEVDIHKMIAHVPWQALTHMIVAPGALFVGPLQYFPSLRARRLKLHRAMGKVYVADCTIAGIGALATAPYATGGPVAGVGFGILAVLWIATTLGAWRAAVARKLEMHRLLMRFSYAMTFGAVTLRLQIPLFLMSGFPSYAAASVWLAYTSWIPNVIAVALYSLWKAPRRPAAMAAAD